MLFCANSINGFFGAELAEARAANGRLPVAHMCEKLTPPA